MSGLRPEPVEVWLSSGKPARFVWRGRLYTVLAVLARWVISSDRPQGQRPQGQRPDVRPPGARREFWRVEAAPGKNVPPAVYELRHDAAADRWLLSRGWDPAGQ